MTLVIWFYLHACGKRHINGFVTCVLVLLNQRQRVKLDKFKGKGRKDESISSCIIVVIATQSGHGIALSKFTPTQL